MVADNYKIVILADKRQAYANNNENSNYDIIIQHRNSNDLQRTAETQCIVRLVLMSLNMPYIVTVHHRIIQLVIYKYVE